MNKIVLILMIASMGVACSRVSPITQHQLRGLRLGMSQDKVVQLLGSPYSRALAAEHFQMDQPVDERWTYNNNNSVADVVRGVRLYAEFSKGRLVHVSSYRRDLDDRTPTLFELSPDGHVQEGKEFAQWFRP